MKLFYLVLVMGIAAVGGGLIVRYSERPAEVAFAHSTPPTVVAPPIPPSARGGPTHVGPSSSVPVRSAPAEPRSTTSGMTPEKPVKREKLSEFSAPVRAVESERLPEPRPAPRVRMKPEPPAVIALERSTVVPPPPVAPAPTPAPVVVVQAAPISAPVHVSAPAPPPVPEGNHATLKAGSLISIRINEALSSNLNSPGDVFSGVLDKPLIADGFVIAERGAHVRGEVVDSKSDGRASELSIRLREVVASDGQRVHLVTDPWRKPGGDTRASSIYDAALTRGGAAVIRATTTVTFRLEDSVELTEKR